MNRVSQPGVFQQSGKVHEQPSRRRVHTCGHDFVLTGQRAGDQEQDQKEGAEHLRLRTCAAVAERS